MSDWLEPVKREKKRNPLFNLLRILMAMIILFSIGLLIGYFFHQGAKTHTSSPILKTTPPSSIHQEQGINQDSGMKRGDYLGEPSFDLNLPYPAKKQSSYQALIPTETYDQTPTLSIPSVQAQKDVPPIPTLKEARQVDVSQNEIHQNERIEDALIQIKAEPEAEIKIETETIEIRDENQNIIESNQPRKEVNHKPDHQHKTTQNPINLQSKKLPSTFFALQIQSLNTLEQANAEKGKLETTYQFDQIKIQKIEVKGLIRYRLHLKINPKREVLEQLKVEYEKIFPELEVDRIPRIIKTGRSDGEWL
jgi:hypothetical protein